LQPGVAGYFRISEQLAFELERGLFVREQDERPATALLRRGKRSFGIVPQGSADFRKAAEGFAAASRADEESHLHGELLTQRREEAKAQRDFISVSAWRKGNVQNSIADPRILFFSAGFFAQRLGARKAIYLQLLGNLGWSRAVISVSFARNQATISNVLEIGTG
jgi:hypothetical protein